MRIVRYVVTTAALLVLALVCAACGDDSNGADSPTKSHLADSATTTASTPAGASTTTTDSATSMTPPSEPASCAYFDQHVIAHPVWSKIVDRTTVTCGEAAVAYDGLRNAQSPSERIETGWSCKPADVSRLPATCTSLKQRGSFTIDASTAPTEPATNLKLTPNDRLEVAAAIRKFSSLDREYPGPLQKGAYYGSFGGVQWAVGCQGEDCTDGPRALIRYPDEAWQGWSSDYGLCTIPQPLLDVWQVKTNSASPTCIP